MPGKRVTDHQVIKYKQYRQRLSQEAAAAKVGISERTAVLHLNNAMHKMDCNNKHQAVLKALRMGLIR